MEPISGEEIGSLSDSVVTWGLFLGYILLGIIVLSLIILPIMNMIKAPKEIKKTFISVGVFAVLFTVSYVLSGSEVTVKYTSMGITEGGSKMIGAGIIMFYLTLFSALISIIYSEIKKAVL